MNFFLKTTKEIACLVLVCFFLNACSKPDRYQIGITAHSEKGYGVIVTKIIAHNTPELPSKLEASNFCEYYIYPTIPSDFDNIFILRNFKGIPHNRLPNYITFEYQFADISECAISRKDKIVTLRFLKDHTPLKKGDIVKMPLEKAENYIYRKKGIVELVENSTSLKEESGTTYYSKYACENWNPIDNKKITNTIDLRAYKNSNEIKKFRKRNKKSSGSYYGTKTIYQFNDQGEIKLHLENYSTNSWN